MAKCFWLKLLQTGGALCCECVTSQATCSDGRRAVLCCCQILMLFIALIAMSLVCTVASEFWTSRYADATWYIGFSGTCCCTPGKAVKKILRLEKDFNHTLQESYLFRRMVQQIRVHLLPACIRFKLCDACVRNVMRMILVF